MTRAIAARRTTPESAPHPPPPVHPRLPTLTQGRAQRRSGLSSALPGGEPPAPDQALEGVLATLQQADIAPIAVIIWGEAIRNPALSQRLSALYRHLADQFTKLVRVSQERGTTDPGTPAEHTAQVLTALGPAFLHQLAFGPALDAPRSPRDCAHSCGALTPERAETAQG
jgi:hypothetical protein